MSTPTEAAAAGPNNLPNQPAVLRKPLRIWPALPFLLYMIGAQIALRTIPNWTPVLIQLVIMGPLVCALAIGLWWLFASRAAWRDRIIGLVGFAVLATAAWFLSDPSMHGMPFMVTVLPIVVVIATVAAVVLARLGSR